MTEPCKAGASGIAGAWWRAKAWLQDNGLTRRLAVDSGWAFGSQVLGLAASLVETFLLARLLGVEQFGVLMVLVAAVGLVYGVLDCRSGEVVIKHLPELRQAVGNPRGVALLRTVLAIDALLAAIGFLLMLVVVRFLGSWLSLPQGSLALCVLLAMGAGLLLTTGSVGAYLRVTKRFPLAAQLSMAGSLVRIVLLLVVVSLLPTVSGGCLALAGADVAMWLLLMAGFRCAMRQEGLRLFDSSERLPRDTLRAVLRFMFHTNLSLTLRTLAKKGDVIVIAALSSTTVVALYKVAQRIAGSLMLVSDPMVTVVYPTLSRYSAQGRQSEIRKLLRLLSYGLGSVALLFLVGFSFAGEWLIGATAGPEFKASTQSCLIMIGGSLLSMVFFWTRPMLLVHDLTGRLLLVNVAATGLRFGALLALLPLLGVAGAAWSFLAYNAASVGGFLLVLRWHGKAGDTENSAFCVGTVATSKDEA